METVDNTQEQMGNLSREMEILSKDQKEILEIKNTITEMNIAFDGQVSGVDMVEWRISED